VALRDATVQNESERGADCAYTLATVAERDAPFIIESDGVLVNLSPLPSLFGLPHYYKGQIFLLCLILYSKIPTSSIIA